MTIGAGQRMSQVFAASKLQKNPETAKGSGFFYCFWVLGVLFRRNLVLVPCVRLTGLEPARRKTPDPKSGASTNFATSAFLILNSEFIVQNESFIIHLASMRVQSYG